MSTSRHLPERPPTSIFFRFLASRMQTVSFPAVGTYRREMQISPSFSGCQAEQGADVKALPVRRTVVLGHGPTRRSPQTLLNLQCRQELAHMQRHKRLITWGWHRPVPAQHPDIYTLHICYRKAFAQGNNGQILPITHGHDMHVIQVGPPQQQPF